MPTPHDPERIAVFKAWFDTCGRTHAEALEEAHRRTGIATRALERMRVGKQPPPVRLLDELARDAADRGHAELAGLLAGAASVGGPHA